MEYTPTGCVCTADGPHVLWSVDCPVHGEMAAEFAARAAERMTR